MRAPTSRIAWFAMMALRTIAVLAGILLSGCCFVLPYRTPEDVPRWQELRPPTLSLEAKAAQFQVRLEARHLTSEGLLRYRRRRDDGDAGSYGNQADGCFHTGIYLASQALRHAATGDPAALEQVRHALGGLEMLMAVTGRRGLLARHFSPTAPFEDARWRHSVSEPGYYFRSDVSKDQYAGFIHGLGVTLALVDDPAVRARVAALAAAAADHLIEHDMRIVDVDGRRTTHGDLSAHVWGLPIGVNALISLAIARVAATATDLEPHRDLYADLVERGYPDVAWWAHFSVFGMGKRVNDNMGYLALYALVLLERDTGVRAELRASAARSWRHLSRDRNAFFALVHAAITDDADSRHQAQVVARTALGEFPEDKVEWPVDVTGPEWRFPRRFWPGKHCVPRTTHGVPLFLRPRGSNFWVSDPYRLAGRLSSRGETETSAGDYLLAYWMARYHGVIGSYD